MMKMPKTIRTIEEFTAAFFPKSSKAQKHKAADAKLFGTQLARESLKKFDRVMAAN